LPPRLAVHYQHPALPGPHDGEDLVQHDALRAPVRQLRPAFARAEMGGHRPAYPAPARPVPALAPAAARRRQNPDPGAPRQG